MLFLEFLGINYRRSIGELLWSVCRSCRCLSGLAALPIVSYPFVPKLSSVESGGDVSGTRTIISRSVTETPSQLVHLQGT